MARESKAALAARAAKIVARLKRAYPDAHCELDFRNPYQLLVATILSAQCTDARVNLVTPEVFRRWPDATSLAAARPGDVEAVAGGTAQRAGLHGERGAAHGAGENADDAGEARGRGHGGRHRVRRAPPSTGIMQPVR